jgi:ABC-type amino acid transport substrate-binding protein
MDTRLHGYGICIGTIILIFISTLTACQSEDATWEHIQETGVIKIGLDPTYPPFEVADENGLYGLDVDLVNAIAADLGLKTEFVLFGYDGLYDALGTHQADLLISALVIVPEKTRDFAYTKPYFNAGELLIVRADEQGVQGMADLNGRSLSVELGAQGHVEATTWARRLTGLTIHPYNTADEALTAVLHHTTDAALIDAISARLFLSQNPSLVALPDPVTVEPFAIAVRVEDGRLLENLNNSLQHLQESGELDRIIATWLD